MDVYVCEISVAHNYNKCIKCWRCLHAIFSILLLHIASMRLDGVQQDRVIPEMLIDYFKRIAELPNKTFII